jgi:hypothetical protein
VSLPAVESDELDDEHHPTRPQPNFPIPTFRKRPPHSVGSPDDLSREGLDSMPASKAMQDYDLHTASALHVASRRCGVGSARWRPTRSRFDLSLHLKASVGRDRRRWPCVDSADDLAAVYALEVVLLMPRFACPS